MDKATLKTVIDAIFAAAKAAAIGHPIVLAAISVLNHVIDDVVLDKIAANLDAKGIVVSAAE